MTIFREIPPTAGFPLYAKDFLSALIMPEGTGCLEDDFKQYLDAAGAFTTCSGTAALYIIAETLKELSLRRTVIIPSFICPLVPLALHRAGLVIEVCDIGKDSFNFDPEAFEAVCASGSDYAAVVINHLAGIPFDFNSIKAIADKYKLVVIEDCAQSLGALFHGRKVGTLGDFSFFSFAAGKGLTLYEGGILITNNREYIPAIDRIAKKLLQNDAAMETLRVLQVLGYGVFYRPGLFWFVFRLPQIFWNLMGKPLRAAMEQFTLDFPVHRVSRFRRSLGHVTFSRLENEISQQRAKALYLIEGLGDVKGIRMISEDSSDRATYPYVTVLFDEPDKRIAALNVLDQSGLGASRIYALAVADYDYLTSMVPDKNCSNARFMVDRAITLSTSTFLGQNDLDAMIRIIRHVL